MRWSYQPCMSEVSVSADSHPKSCRLRAAPAPTARLKLYASALNTVCVPKAAQSWTR
jgi:hypothetical protein